MRPMMLAGVAALALATPVFAQEADTTAHVAVNGRVERYDDPGGVIAPGPTTNGASLGIDVSRGPATWRTEVRGFFGARHPVFPGHDGAEKSDVAAVTSISLRL